MKILPLPIDIILYDFDILYRYWTNVDRKSSEECWNWVGWLMGPNKSGNRNPGISINKKQYVATRVGYFIQSKIDPEDNLVLHLCNNHICQNIKHLYLGNMSDNTIDSFLTERSRCEGTKNGRCKISEEDVQDIRRMYDEGYSKTELSLIFKIGRTQVSRIINKEQWINLD